MVKGVVSMAKEASPLAPLRGRGERNFGGNVKDSKFGGIDLQAKVNIDRRKLANQLILYKH